MLNGWFVFIPKFAWISFSVSKLLKVCFSSQNYYYYYYYYYPKTNNKSSFFLVTLLKKNSLKILRDLAKSWLWWASFEERIEIGERWHWEWSSLLQVQLEKGFLGSHMLLLESFTVLFLHWQCRLGQNHWGLPMSWAYPIP